MNADIEAIVNDLKKVSVEQVTFEAINNAIQAGATEINIYFYEKNTSCEGITEFQTIDSIKIIDNGEGFTPDNIESFKIYRSTHKKKLGAKGIGRFLYLKLFSKVTITSLSKKIIFTVNHDVEITNKIPQIKTEVCITNPKNSYQINKENYTNEVSNHFLPHFKLLHDQGKEINIRIFFNDDNDETVVTNTSIPNFKVDSFKIKKQEFTLNYLLNSETIKANNDGFYCAANRVVSKNSELRSSKFNSFYGVKLLFLLSSDYFDSTVNDERNDFYIKPTQINNDITHNISWADIHESLAKKIKEICLVNDIDIEKEARKNLQTSIDKAPFLAPYLSKNEYSLSSSELLKKAKKDYDKEKEFLRNPKNISTLHYKVTLNRVVQSELAEYIFDREKIITRLRSFVDDELIEQEIHNLFIKKGTVDSSQNYRSNNLWLFDDRFMSYDKIFSEVEIRTAFPELSEIVKRLDICIISNTYSKEDITDVVIIELKRPDETITPARAEEQLLEYARYVNSTRPENKIRIWAYAFLKFTNDTEDKLKDKSYNHIPTHSQFPIYYLYHARPNIIINFMDYSALADDAHTRNATFINILKGQTIA